MLLLKLFETAIKASQDSDKVRSNAARALGNFLRYLPERCHGEGLKLQIIMQDIYCDLCFAHKNHNHAVTKPSIIHQKYHSQSECWILVM